MSMTCRVSRATYSNCTVLELWMYTDRLIYDNVLCNRCILKKYDVKKLFTGLKPTEDVDVLLALQRNSKSARNAVCTNQAQNCSAR